MDASKTVDARDEKFLEMMDSLRDSNNIDRPDEEALTRPRVVLVWEGVFNHDITSMIFNASNHNGLWWKALARILDNCVKNAPDNGFIHAYQYDSRGHWVYHQSYEFTAKVITAVFYAPRRKQHQLLELLYSSKF